MTGRVRNRPTRARSQARRAAVQAVYQWQISGLDPREIAAQFGEHQLPERMDFVYFQELLTNVAERTETLDQALVDALDRPIEQVDPVELAILRIGTFELLFQPDVPLKVIINEGVELAKVFGAEESHRYINGILDAVGKTARSDQASAFVNAGGISA